VKSPEKLVVVIMGQDCEKFIGMCLESVKDADAIVYCDGGSKEETFLISVQKWLANHESHNCAFIENKYDKEDLGMNGKQRNFYLGYIKENYPAWWCLAIDADEVVEDLGKIKEMINRAPPGVYSVKMRHFIGDLGHEDSTIPEHFVPNRLFKISAADKYPEVEHPVLKPKKNMAIAGTKDTTIWHLAYIPNMWEIKKRYENHLKKSNMHTPEFLKQWYEAHLFGNYARSQINIEEVPSIILKEFGIEPDEIYFRKRGIEMKHPLMVKQWYDHFKPFNVLELGAGRGPYLFFWEWFVPSCNGIEISEWAVKNQFLKDRIMQGDISDEKVWGKIGPDWDLITAIDVLEHLDDEQLKNTLELMANNGSKFLFSIPFEGDPNLEKDKSHKQFKTKEEWIKLIESFGIKIKETPNWLFANQILIGENDTEQINEEKERRFILEAVK